MTPRPFTVIGGFLGAGKTTLVNHILTASTGVRYAVMVNDFGAINVDADLIMAHDGQTMALANGCICCSLADGFVQAMLLLMDQPDSFDHIIVEASGVAQPSRIMDFARIDPLLSADAIVTLVDAGSITERLADPLIADAVAAQITSADILVLNKTDLICSVDLTGIEERLRDLNNDAPLLHSKQSALPLDLVLGTASAGAASAVQAADIQVHTAHLTSDRPIDPPAFDAWTQALPQEVLRGKGWVVLNDDATPRVWQRVGHRMSLTKSETTHEITELVLISTMPINVDWPFGSA